MTGSSATPDEQALCAAAALADRGVACLFDVAVYGQPARAFALRIGGTVVAYVNRCVHVPNEMDWVPGHFLDAERRFIVCSIHGAEYDPADGRCIGGPCHGGRLMSIRTAERDGQVYWYASEHVRPVAPAEGRRTESRS